MGEVSGEIERGFYKLTVASSPFLAGYRLFLGCTSGRRLFLSIGRIRVRKLRERGDMEIPI